MKLPTSAKLSGATVAIFIASFSVPLYTQTPSSQPTAQVLAEAAALDLPEALLPQVDIQPPPPALGSSSSQQSAPAAPAPAAGSAQPTSGTSTPADAKRQQHDEAERELKVQEKQRLLGVMPQFQVVMGGQVVPLTGGEKWRLALHSAVDPFYIGWAFVIGGGWGEVEDSNSGYGWGDEGYFKRVGANYADNVNGALIGNALLPQLLHQDPRYFRKGTGSFGSRFMYAALSTVICHGDNGKKQANVSNVLGNYISGAISNAYYPANEPGVALTLQNGTSVTLFGALGGQILEFGPDLSRLIAKKRHKIPTVVTPPPADTAPASTSK